MKRRMPTRQNIGTLCAVLGMVLSWPVTGWAQAPARAMVCMAVAGQAAHTLLVVPSGTVFALPAPRHGRHAPAVAGQALVTTETVTLTTDQPCMGADASSVLSHTRNWLVVPVKPVQGSIFHAVGRVSGNGLDTALSDEDDDFRAQMRAGKLSASPRGVLDDVIALQETDADLPQSDDTATGNTSQIERELTSDLPHASRP